VVKEGVQVGRKLTNAKPELLKRKRMFWIIKEAGEIKKILTSAVKTAQENP